MHIPENTNEERETASNFSSLIIITQLSKSSTLQTVFFLHLFICWNPYFFKNSLPFPLLGLFFFSFFFLISTKNSAISGNLRVPYGMWHIHLQGGRALYLRQAAILRRNQNFLVFYANFIRNLKATNMFTHSCWYFPVVFSPHLGNSFHPSEPSHCAQNS